MELGLKVLINRKVRRVRSDSRSLDGACVSGMQFGGVLLPGSCFFYVSFAKSEVFRGYFFELCCRWWSDEAWGCPALHRDSSKSLMLKAFQCTGRFTSTWFEGVNQTALQHCCVFLFFCSHYDVH